METALHRGQRQPSPSCVDASPSARVDSDGRAPPRSGSRRPSSDMREVRSEQHGDGRLGLHSAAQAQAARPQRLRPAAARDRSRAHLGCACGHGFGSDDAGGVPPRLSPVDRPGGRRGHGAPPAPRQCRGRADVAAVLLARSDRRPPPSGRAGPVVRATRGLLGDLRLGVRGALARTQAIPVGDVTAARSAVRSPVRADRAQVPAVRRGREPLRNRHHPGDDRARRVRGRAMARRRAALRADVAGLPRDDADRSAVEPHGRRAAARPRGAHHLRDPERHLVRRGADRNHKQSRHVAATP